MYAIWFVFEKNDNKYFLDIIQKLCTKYKSPLFTPHITAYGLVDASLDNLDRMVIDSIKEERQFIVEKIKVSYSDDFWKTFFVEFQPNDVLERINKRLTAFLKSFNKYEFKPHASLIYKKMS